jgi:hypothetical protein
MTGLEKKRRGCLLFAIAAVVTFMVAMAWLQAAYFLLCAATGFGAIVGLVVARHMILAVFAVGMNGLAFINLVVPATRAFIDVQRRKGKNKQTPAGSI